MIRLKWYDVLGSVLVVVFLASFALPSMRVGALRSEMIPALSNATQLYIAAQQAALDRQQAGDGGSGFPFETHSRTSPEYLRSLVQNQYLKVDDLARLHPDQFVFANISFNDSPETILLVSRNYYDAVILKKGQLKKPFIVILKYGEAQSYRPDWFAEHPDKIGQFPPRDPAFLAP